MTHNSSALLASIIGCIELLTMVDPTRKQAILEGLRAEGLTPDRRTEAVAMLREGLAEIDRSIEDTLALAEQIEEYKGAVENDIAPAEDDITAEYERDAQAIGNEFASVCMRTERGMEQDVEKHQQKGESNEIDAIRASLKQE